MLGLVDGLKEPLGEAAQLLGGRLGLLLEPDVLLLEVVHLGLELLGPGPLAHQLLLQHRHPLHQPPNFLRVGGGGSSSGGGTDDGAG